ncbi:MAG: type II secretion system F family protein [Pirellulales bacterium]
MSDYSSLIALALSGMLVLCGLAVLVALRLAYAEARSFSDPAHTLFMIIGWGLIVVGVIVANVILLAGFSLLPLIVFLVVLGIMINWHWAAQQNALLWVLIVTTERLIPLASAVEAFAYERGGRFGRRAAALAYLLQDGVPLPEALERLPGLLPPSAVLAVRLGYETGALAPALREAAAGGAFRQPLWAAMADKVFYVVGLVVFAAGVITFMMLKITPAFEKIFQDFGVDLPLLTRYVIAVAGSEITQLSLSLFVFVGFWFLVYLALRRAGVVRWSLPLLDRLMIRVDGAVVLRTLAVVAEKGRPLYPAFQSLAATYPKRLVRRKLWSVVRQLETGADWCESLRGQGLIGRAESSVLQSAERVGNLPWAMREMAESSQRRLAYRLNALGQLMFPLALLAFGGLVFVIVVGYFLPLVTVIQSLA